MEIISTIKGKPCALYAGYAYRKFNESKDGRVTWICLKEKSKKCRGRLASQGEDLKPLIEHTCGPPEEGYVEVKKSVYQARKRAREEDTSVSQIYSEEIINIYSKGYDFVTDVPKQQSMKRNLRRTRCTAKGYQKEPTREDIELNEEMVKMRDGSSFLMKEDGIQEKIIVLSGKFGQDSLKTQNHYFMDGTFKSCSKQFQQIYTIHADFGSNKEETHIYPVVFAFLPNKKKETYKRLFRLFLECVPEWKPTKIQVDFEGAAISAIREVFPATDIKGCYFHMKKCLWRKVQDLGLTKDYTEDEDVRLHIRMCSALAFLKPEDVEDGWLNIHSSAPSNPKLTEFFDYFVERWLENDEVPVQIWNCHRERHRTTNSVEGWNNRLNTIVGKANPRFREVFLALKNEAEQANGLIMRINLCLEGNKRRRIYIKHNDRIERSMEKYEENKDIRQCLKSLAYVQKLE